MSYLHPILNHLNSYIIMSGLESASCYDSIGIVLEMRGKFADMLDDTAMLTQLSNLGEINVGPHPSA